jgi:arylsulfatase A-like enzyme
MIRFAFLLTLAVWLTANSPLHAADQPNIVVILCDDLGYGDVQCYGGKIPTPHIDALATSGLRFTDAHTSSSVCSPTRYGLITGRYNWRSPLKRGVLGGLSPRLIEPGRATIASLLKEHGYHTACIGKWHLGMDWSRPADKPVSELNIEPRGQVFNVDYGAPIKNGPNSVGFDYYYGISASLDMVPYTFIENDHVVELPTLDSSFLMMHGRENGGTTRKGPTAPGFDAEDVLPRLAEKSCEYITQHAPQAKQGKPFFLYVPFASPHTPILPTKPWQGKSGMNPYADFVMQTDDAVGQILDALAQSGVADNTLVIFTSDNGCSPQAKFDELARYDHHPSGPLRGHKADIFEGGLRVPFIVRWPGRVAAGKESAQVVCLIDILATAADILDIPVPENAAEDSISFRGALQGDAEGGRQQLVSHSINGSFAIRRGPWKLALCPDSGGWSAPRPGSKEAESLPPLQLFNLNDDLGETKNVAAEHPEVVAELTQILETLVANGRSTPGPKQANTGEVNIRAGLPKQDRQKGKKS